MSTTKEIKVQGVFVEVDLPYAEGHTVTEAEAAALNQTLTENIRNNTARFVKDAMKENEVDSAEALPEEVVTDLITRITEYAAGYEFTMASVGGGRTPKDPVDAEAVKVAKELIGAQLKAAGKKIKDLDPDKYATAVATVAAKDDVRATAQARIDERNKAAAAALDGVDL